jgi:hypothetical protein
MQIKRKKERKKERRKERRDGANQVKSKEEKRRRGEEKRDQIATTVPVESSFFKLGSFCEKRVSIGCWGRRGTPLLFKKKRKKEQHTLFLSARDKEREEMTLCSYCSLGVCMCC